MTSTPLEVWQRRRVHTVHNFLTMHGLPAIPGYRAIPGRKPADRPDKPVRLYRGATPDTCAGVYWTDLPAVAAVYANDCIRDGWDGRVYTAVIPPEWIIHRLNIGDPNRPVHPYIFDNGEHLVHPAAFDVIPIHEMTTSTPQSV